MEPAVRLEVIRCAPLGAKLTRASCGAKYADAQATQTLHLGTEGRLRGTRCRDCGVGYLHDKGTRAERWADGAPVELASIEIASAPSAIVPRVSPAPRTPARREPAPAPKEESMARPCKKFPLGDREVTVPELAVELGVSTSAIYARQKHGESLDEIVTALSSTKATEPPPKARARSAPREKPRRAKPPRSVPRAADVSGEVREQLRSIGLVDLAQRLGYPLEDLGSHPRGRLFLLPDEA